MCCFSRPVKDVSATKILARWTSAEGGMLRQCVVYQMNYVAAEDLAMVLPLPVAPGSGEKAVTFIDLEKHADIFDKLYRCFPEPRLLSLDLRCTGKRSSTTRSTPSHPRCASPQ